MKAERTPPTAERKPGKQTADINWQRYYGCIRFNANREFEDGYELAALADGFLARKVRAERKSDDWTETRGGIFRLKDANAVWDWNLFVEGDWFVGFLIRYGSEHGTPLMRLLEEGGHEEQPKSHLGMLPGRRGGYLNGEYVCKRLINGDTVLHKFEDKCNWSWEAVKRFDSLEKVNKHLLSQGADKKTLTERLKRLKSSGATPWRG